jgi:SOS-response transcriptional repressor LexA
MEPSEYVYVPRPGGTPGNIEGYRVKNSRMEPDILNGDIVIVDRNGQVREGDVVTALVDGQMYLGKATRKDKDKELWLENNDGRIRLKDVQVPSVVLSLQRMLK